jgi:hypothetical protein
MLKPPQPLIIPSL